MKSLEFHTLYTGNVRTDGGAMFGVAPKLLWQKIETPDAENRIPIAMRNLLIRDAGRIFIVDTGIGDYNNNPTFIKHHNPDVLDYDHDVALKKHDLTTNDVTDVILTHLHYDHAGGVVTGRNGELTATFPNARIWLQREQWQWANNPSDRDRAGYMPAYMDFLRNRKDLELVDGKSQITPNMTVLPFYGHTPGMQCILFETEGEQYFYATDLFPLASHLHIPYVMAFDLEPLKTLAEKKRIADQAIADEWTLVFQHDPNHETGQLEQHKGRYRLKQ